MKGQRPAYHRIQKVNNSIIDINTIAGQVAGRLILSKEGLFRLMIAAFGGIEDCSSYIYSTKPAKPLKGRGYSRHIFDIEQSESAKRFYEALPERHKDKISERHNSNYKRYTWDIIISDEAKQIWDIYGQFF